MPVANSCNNIDADGQNTNLEMENDNLYDFKNNV